MFRPGKRAIAEPADAGLLRFLAFDASRATTKPVSIGTVPPPEANRAVRDHTAQGISFEKLLAEVERAHERIYAPQYGITSLRIER